MNKTFLYRTKAADDRDCCAYIESPKFECGHYFSHINPCGACYSGGEFKPYDKIDTFLTEKEYNKIISFNKAIDDLGYGITKGDDRYNKGMKLCAEIQPIFDKLESSEATEYFEENILESEIEFITENYPLSYDEAVEALDNYKLSYRDRAIIDQVYESVSILGFDEMENLFSCYHMPDNYMNYFDYESFGNDIVNDDEFYYELSSGYVVRYNL